jgi:hypothetical protein
MWESVRKQCEAVFFQQGGHQMRKHELYQEFHDQFEYFGNTEIERIRKKGSKTIRRDWIIFNTVDEAMEFFKHKVGEFMGYYV